MFEFRKLVLTSLALVLTGFLMYLPCVLVDRWLEREFEISKKTYLLAREVEIHRQNKLDIQLRARLLDKGAIPMFFPNLLLSPGEYKSLARELEVAPLAPQPLTHLYYCNEGYGMVNYVSDRFGFRNHDELWDVEQKTFIIGDSFVQGACIPDQSKTLTGNINSETAVISLGTSANGPIHYAAIAKAVIPAFQPKNVVMVFYPNDNLWLLRDNEESYFYEHYWESQSKPYFTNTAVEPLLNNDLKRFYTKISELLLADILSQTASKSDEKTRPDYYDESINEIHRRAVQEWSYPGGFKVDNFGLQHIRATIKNLFSVPDSNLPFAVTLAIDELRKACTAECKPLVVYIPNSELWRPDSRAKVFKRNLSAYVKSEGISFIDSSYALKTLTDSEIYAVKGPHLSPLGYHIVGELISASISR